MHVHEHGADERYPDLGVGAFERLPAMSGAQRNLILKRAVADVRALRGTKTR